MTTTGPKKQVVLVSTGSHNIPHLGHLNMMEITREQLEAQGYEVVQIYMSPTHQDYVGGKKYNPAVIDGVKYPRPILLTVKDEDCGGV